MWKICVKRSRRVCPMNIRTITCWFLGNSWIVWQVSPTFCSEWQPEMKLGFSSTIPQPKDRVQSGTLPSYLDQRRPEWANQEWNPSSSFFLIQRELFTRSLCHPDRLGIRFYLQVLEHLRNRVVRIRREIANTWFLHHDSAPSHTSFAVREFSAQHNITMLPHPPYSRDLAPWDFFLLPKLKTHLKGHHFGTVENVQAAATRALNNISSKDFLHCYEEWQQCWNRCIRSQGAYFEGDKL